MNRPLRIALLTINGRKCTVQLAMIDLKGQITRKDSPSYVGTDRPAAITEQLRLRREYECGARAVQS